MICGIGRALFVTAVLASAPSAFAQSSAPPPAGSTIRGGGVTVEIEKDRPTPPDGDPRSTDERREDHAAFTKCVNSMQGSNMMIGTAGLPPDPIMYCQQRLGMANADAVPDSVKQRTK